MPVRDAVPADLSACLDMARHGCEAMETGIPFDDVSALKTLSDLMDMRGLLVLTAPDDTVIGMAGVFAAACLWNSRVKTAAQIFIWVEPEYRGRGVLLLRAVIALMREMGAGIVGVVARKGLKDAGLGKLYERMGFELAEYGYRKVLSDG